MGKRPDHVGKNVKGTPAIGCCAGGLGLILLLRATYLLPTEYKGGFCRYDVIDLTTKLPTVAIAESEFSNLKADFKTSANALKADGADRRPVPTPERTMSPVKHENRALVGGTELENFR